MDKEVMSIVKEDGASSGKDIIEAVRQWIVEKFLQVRRTWEGEDMENQWYDRKGISPIKLTPHCIRMERRLHHQN
jgi:hypothetical protein